MIEPINIEKALEYIRINAPLLAKAKADRIYLTEFRKSKKALLYNDAPEGTVKFKESYAYAHEDYIQLLKDLKISVNEEEKLKWMMVAAQTKCDIWRSLNASARLVDKLHV